MKPQQQQLSSPVFNILESNPGHENKTKASKKLAKEITKTLSELSEDIDAIVKKRITKEDRKMVKELKHQQKKLRKERRAAAVAELLKGYKYTF
ncbi:hypothetical protein [Dyadobacter sp. NIV53]|uniref:hypothetical protein n=1 Tax=Dyadobacter sp. NIV53 TaxID=2861765 RepID=UPI001C87D641|nr:hypothetical protein [Dyadobacter sp. NIV53]